MRMRELEQRTGVNRETIRVYFREGLLPEPSRPKPNVAIYDEGHVRAIAAIRALQQAGRLPLGQIRQALAGDAEAMPSDASDLARLESLLADRAGHNADLVPLTTVLPLNPHAAADAEAFERAGVIRLTRRRDGPHLSRTDAQLVGLWGRMRAAGFDERHGFEPGVARLYVEAAQSLARAEVSTFLSIIAGRVEEGEAADLALTALRLMLDFFGLLRMKAVLAEFGTQTAPASSDRSDQNKSPAAFPKATGPDSRPGTVVSESDQ